MDHAVRDASADFIESLCAEYQVITDYLESYTLEDLAQLRGYQIEYII